MKEELRKYPRVIIKVVVDYEDEELMRLLVDSPDSEAYLFDYSTNFSEGGIFLKTAKNMELGKLINFNFSLPDTAKVYHVKGKVVWKNTESGPIKELGRGVGIEFIDMENATREEIANFVKNLQR
jgi:uncharacterized protein (TIGR02266 family)